MKCLSALIAGLALTCTPALAQMARRNPFSIGVTEGAVGQAGQLGLWLLRRQAEFYQALRLGVDAARHDPHALLGLAGAAFAYGVFHAAGPGHGKAVISSYMLANERALKRGVILSFLASGWQALVAIMLVGVATLLLGVTAQTMTAATALVEKVAFAAVAAFGAWLSWRKGAALWATVQTPLAKASSRFRCDGGGDDGAAAHSVDCPHCIAPDPARLGDGFSWRQAAATVFAAGSRPCSGALLVLVFAAAVGAFSIGLWAVAAMALGTAITTSGLAASAVLFKSAVNRVLGAQSRRAEIFGRGLEALAAVAVLALGLSLLLGLWASGG